MSLESGSIYPPAGWHPINSKYREWAAWWEGDEARLSSTYAGVGPTVRPSQYSGGVQGAVARFFWGKPTAPGVTSTKLHLPVPADLAATSAEQVYASVPMITSEDTRTQAQIDSYLEDLWLFLKETFLSSILTCIGVIAMSIFLHFLCFYRLYFY